MNILPTERNKSHPMTHKQIVENNENHHAPFVPVPIKVKIAYVMREPFYETRLTFKVHERDFIKASVDCFAQDWWNGFGRYFAQSDNERGVVDALEFRVRQAKDQGKQDVDDYLIEIVWEILLHLHRTAIFTGRQLGSWLISRLVLLLESGKERVSKNISV